MKQSTTAPGFNQRTGACLRAGTLCLVLFVWPGTLYGERSDLDRVSGPAGNGPGILTTGLLDEKVVYGDDDRLDVYEETNPSHVAWAASTCALVDDSDLIDNGNGTYTLSTTAFLYSGRPPCSDEPYGDQPVAPFCTGFMVGDDLLATAGHCVSESDLASTRFLFGFDMVDATTAVLVFDAEQVYRGVEVMARRLSDDDDFSVIRVDRLITAPDAQALPLRETDTIAVGQQVGVIGHPSGLPKKIAFGSETRVRKNNAQGYFNANLDTYGGNSGSPVFNTADGVVEGILVRGNTDFTIDGDCFRSNVLEDTMEESERVSKSAQFAGWVYGTIVPPENDLFDSASIFAPGANRVTGTNVYATREPEEPNHAGEPGGGSVWWRWTAPFDGGVVLDTRGSDFDTLLAVYTGSALADIRAVAANDDMPNSRQSQATFSATSKTVYHIVVDGYNGAQGAITLNLAPRLTLTPAKTTVTAERGTATFTLNTAASWTASSDQGWASLSSTAGEGNAVLTVSFSPNDGAEHSAIITVTGQGTSPAWAAAILVQEADVFPGCCPPIRQKGVIPTLRQFLGDGLLLGLSFIVLWGCTGLGRNRFRK